MNRLEARWSVGTKEWGRYKTFSSTVARVATSLGRATTSLMMYLQKEESRHAVEGRVHGWRLLKR